MAEELFLKGDYRETAKACEDILYLARRYRSKKRYLDRMHYLAGVSYLKLNNTRSAKAHLSKIISEYANSSLIDDAHLALAEAHFLEEDYDEAGRLLTHYVRTYPNEPSASQAYLRLGQIAQKRGGWEEAKYYFDKVKKDYPLSFEAKLAPSLVDEEDTFFSVQLGYFSSLDNAKKLKRKLEKKGYSLYIIEVRSAGSTFYRVRAGKLSSRAEAKHLANKLKKEGFEAKIYP